MTKAERLQAKYLTKPEELIVRLPTKKEESQVAAQLRKARRKRKT